MPEQASQQASQPAATRSGFWAEIESMKSPESKDVAPEPKVGENAPTAPELVLPDGRKTLILFLRHCGCPSVSEMQRDVHCIAVSHSSPEATERWIPQVGGAWHTDVIIDEGRDLYAKWGLGLSNTWHAFNPMALYSVYRLGADEGIWNRPTESGSRWQKSGAFAVDEAGMVRWRHISKTADDLPDFDAALEALGIVSDDQGKN
ncbi:peroxiredoxin (PRX)-like 2 family protein [Metarhizium robertsii]|uniref:Peroxiredoxin (PRX)-like 2 family protein n=1 Tax=Metarhizium robertsii TaxID=568076 RepID=A0A0A1V089_9HYPO|nr:peroxiredoxin (PRX)-like 2 family protein [Metarhizium robertsii]